MKVRTHTLDFYVSKIEAREPFTFVRYGDGEWSAIFKDRKRTSSRSQDLTVAGLGDMMTKSVVKAYADNYFPALRRTAMKLYIRQWLDNNVPNIHWHDCTTFYKASKHGSLYPFVKAVRELGWPVVVLGPERLRSLDGRVFDIAKFIQIPNKDCWAQRGRVMKELRRVQGPAFFTLTAGPAAKPWCWQLYATHQDSFILDLGSLFDPYCNPPKISRSYHKRVVRTPGILRKNLTGK